ncbi:hypothetical protein [Lactobacillus ultunensis]|uniref:Uncharacterized protein n=1 Tax=Lactobacillus ultunensis DSM 16047 TaxID=525365 RepID=C2EPA6_9LACO|nr:hypothetical protein [Lactobacillus ultunensis]EEJ71601.1 hypothetical protein HMPREF0548_1502 [Lactobacillus ultunensis DSM 16047]KRL82464.1 hypothetical protein FC57_GL001894 [Lactobacillus ultunensis DSM 16047]QQP28417.1 hypothetical protein H4B44_10050 [Lactobacillus ultunensis]
MKRIKSIIFSVLVLLGVGMSSQTIYASSQSVYAHYRVHASGNGISSGKTNNVWHYLNKNRRVTLRISSSTGAGSGLCTLKRKGIILDKNFGQVSSNVGTHHFGLKTDKTSGQYFLEFYGGNANNTHTIHGTIHD